MLTQHSFTAYVSAKFKFYFSITLERVTLDLQMNTVGAFAGLKSSTGSSCFFLNIALA